MSTYAIFGATGNTGSSLIEILLQSPDAHIHAYCRNKAKLLRLMPGLLENKRVKIFEGQLGDTALFMDCVRGCKVIFLTATTNDNVPGCRIATEAAQGVVKALEKLRLTSNPSPAKMPKIVLLSSATIDNYLSRKMPGWFKPIMLTAASHVYDDLRVAEDFLRDQKDWLSTIFIKPAGLSVDRQRGHKLSLDDEESFISYLDLAAAMIEAANEEDGRYDFRNVSVVNTGGSAKFPRGTPMCILLGLLRHFFPWAHSYLPSSGPA